MSLIRTVVVFALAGYAVRQWLDSDRRGGRDSEALDDGHGDGDRGGRRSNPTQPSQAVALLDYDPHAAPGVNESALSPDRSSGGAAADAESSASGTASGAAGAASMGPTAGS